MNNRNGCPNLGIRSDADTHFGDPSSENFCHKVIPPARVDLGHQRIVCLGSEYSKCPVYSQDWKGSLPSSIRMEVEPALHAPRTRLWMWFALVGVIGIILAGIYLIQPEFFPFWPTLLPEGEQVAVEMLIGPSATEKPLANHPTSTPVAAVPPTPSPTTQLIPTVTPTGIMITLPTETLAATATPISAIPTIGPGLMTPFGPNREYIFYQVQPGDNLPHLAANYQTTTDAIIAVNGLEPNRSLQPGQVIVVTWPIEGQEIVALPIHSVEEATTAAEIALQYDISVDDLRHYNDLGSSEMIPAGRWVMIPPKANPNNLSTEPFGPNNEYVLYQVKPGDSIPILQNLYQTSADVIRTANSIVGSLQVNQVIVIVAGETDPTQVQPFKVFFVEKETLISDLATYLRTTEFDLIYFNDLEAEKPVKAGRWLIYPTNK